MLSAPTTEFQSPEFGEALASVYPDGRRPNRQRFNPLSSGKPSREQTSERVNLKLGFNPLSSGKPSRVGVFVRRVGGSEFQSPEFGEALARAVLRSCLVVSKLAAAFRRSRRRPSWQANSSTDSPVSS